MADEAVLRIILQDAGRTGGSAPPATSGVSPASPTPPQQRTAPSHAVTDTTQPSETQKGAKSGLDVILEIANKLRGTIGGLTGAAVGAALDIIAAIREAQSETPKGRGKGIAPPTPSSPLGGDGARLEPIFSRAVADFQQAVSDFDRAVQGLQRVDFSTSAKDFAKTQRETRDAVVDAKKPVPPTKETKAASEPFQPPRLALPPPSPRLALPPPSGPIGPLRGEIAEHQGQQLPAKRKPIIEVIPHVLPAAGEGGASAATGAAEGVAGAAGGALGGLASAVPIAGAIIAVKAAVDRLVIGAIKSVVGGFSDLATAIASPDSDPAVPMRKLGDATSKAGESIAMISPLLGYMAVGVGETTKALADLMQVLDKTAQKYGEYNPQIASALAIAEIRQTVGDIRRAQEVGPQFAQYIQAQSDLQQKYEDIKIKLLMRILPLVTRIVAGIDAMLPSGEGIESAIRTLTPLAGVSGLLAEWLIAFQESKNPLVKDPADQIRELTDFVPTE